MHPISTVDKTGFRCLAYKLNPRFNCPSRKHFSEKELPQLYANVGDTKIKPQLDRISYFSITTDFWASSLHDLYLSLTLHHVDHEWNLKSINLETTPMFQDHIGLNIYQALTDILEYWNLCLDKLTCVTTDNGSNFIAAFSDQDVLRLSMFRPCYL